jgi:hypothetical protein
MKPSQSEYWRRRNRHDVGAVLPSDGFVVRGSWCGCFDWVRWTVASFLRIDCERLTDFSYRAELSDVWWQQAIFALHCGYSLPRTKGAASCLSKIFRGGSGRDGPQRWCRLA